MKTTKKLFLLLVLAMTIGINVPSTVEARMPPIYPIWGYNTQDHICQIKQDSETSTISENLTGDYWSIRECRYENPGIIFYTGGGILIWFSIFIMVFLFHHVIFPKLEKRTKAEKVLFSLQDITIIGVVLFFIILLQHFFAIPYAVYDYQADIDHIIYSTLIRSQIPLYFAGAYFVIGLIRAVFIYRKNKK
ncbi:MAG: hypothetical protein NUV81_01960 [bacterium]|nr:hypothetical protein [bacterium]